MDLHLILILMAVIIALVNKAVIKKQIDNTKDAVKQKGLVMKIDKQQNVGFQLDHCL